MRKLRGQLTRIWKRYVPWPESSTGETHGGTTNPFYLDGVFPPSKREYVSAYPREITRYVSELGYTAWLNSIYGKMGTITLGNAFHNPDNSVRPEDDPPWSVIQCVEYCDCQCTNCSGCLGL